MGFAHHVVSGLLHDTLTSVSSYGSHQLPEVGLRSPHYDREVAREESTAFINNEYSLASLSSSFSCHPPCSHAGADGVVLFHTHILKQSLFSMMSMKIQFAIFLHLEGPYRIVF